MNLTDRTTINAVRSTFAALDLAPPKALADAIDRAERLASSNVGAETVTLEQAVVDAVLADRDPSTDPQVQAATTAQMLRSNHGLDEAVTAAGHEGIREACLSNLDAIVGKWAKPFDKAAATLAQAYDRIGGVPLEDTAPILARGGDIADVWAGAQNAVATIEQVLNGWSSLMSLVRVQLNPAHRPLRLAALSLEQYRTLPAKLGGWAALDAGLALSLPTLDEYRQRVAGIQRAQSQYVESQVPVDREREATKSWAARMNAAR